VATSSQPVVYLAPSNPISLTVENNGTVLNLVTGGPTGR
jgi:hypothetical protein